MNNFNDDNEFRIIFQNIFSDNSISSTLVILYQLMNYLLIIYQHQNYYYHQIHSMKIIILNNMISLINSEGYDSSSLYMLFIRSLTNKPIHYDTKFMLQWIYLNLSYDSDE